MTNILVTGASGFIGRHLVPYLQSQGDTIRCSTQRLEANNDWTEELQDIDVIIHLAGHAHVVTSSRNINKDQVLEINTLATKNLAEQASAHGVKRLIYLSSIKAAPDTNDIYAHSKWLAEQYLYTIAYATNLEIVVLRPTLVYGPEVKANFKQMLKIVRRGWPLPFKALKNQRSFIYIDNLLSAILAVLTDPRAANQSFSLADAESFAMNELLKQIANAMGKKSRLFAIPQIMLVWIFKLLGLRNLKTRLLDSFLVTNQAIETTLEWRPPVSALDGLKKTVEWYARHELL